MITILNTSILTSFGLYKYEPVKLETIATQLQAGLSYQSAVGHQSTADILTELLGVPVPMNRIEYKQEAGDVALVFKLKGRPEEGQILSCKEIEKIGYEFGALHRIE